MIKYYFGRAVKATEVLLQSDLTKLQGIGTVRASLFKKLGIGTIEELLYYFPRSYENFADIYKLREAPEGKVCIKARLLSDARIITPNAKTTVITASATDGTDIMSLTFFNNRYIADKLKSGLEYLFYGELKTNSKGGFEMSSPEVCDILTGGGYHPVYRCTEGLRSSAISVYVKNAIRDYAPLLPEVFPEKTLKKYRIPDIKTAVSLIHFPKNEAEIINARRRLIFEELLTLSLGLKLIKTSGKSETPFVIRNDYSEAFLKSLPFSPTNAQRRAIEECTSDMRSPLAMRRLIQGDVGSGKTAVAAALIYNTVKNGFQAVLMAPTEVLARQHKKSFDGFFADTGIKIELLTGSTPQKEKNRIKSELESGSVNLLIGTHAVITADVKFKSLGLAVTDEQHRFGVRQRTALGDKGMNPHVLVMSATPIPRTLSLVVYGDLDISVLDEKPSGRKEVKTFRITSEKRLDMYGFIKKQLDCGHQCFIVCPLAEDKENGDSDSAETTAEGKELLNAERYYRELSSDTFSKYRTGLLHGKMTPKQKDKIMNDFAAGEIRLLVCTVVVEVGIDVPNATVIAIENAERFGLSQLHQLRGRCGRGSEKSYCILISDSHGKDAEQRFNTLCSTNDGFLIAEEDLRMRGPGDFFGERQSGIPDLKIANLMTDTRILYAAKNAAEEILNSDPTLSSKKNALLSEKTKKLFSGLN